ALSTTNGTWSDADGDGRTYSYQWYRADDNSGTNLTAISGATSANYTLSSSDGHKYLRVVVTANDGQGGTQTATSAYTAITNSAPVFTSSTSASLSIYDGTNAAVITAAASDAENDTRSYSLVSVNSVSSGGDFAKFAIDGSTGALTAVNAANLTAGSYTVVVRADDGHGGTTDQTVTVTVAGDLVVTVNAIDSSAPTGTYSSDVADGGGLDLYEALAIANNQSGPITIRFASSLSGTITLGGTYTVRDGVTLAMDSSGNSRSLTITGNGFTLGSGLGISVATGDMLTINSTLADDGTVTSALSKSGDGRLVLGGTNNTTSGGTSGTGLNTISVTAGTLGIGSDSNLGTGTVTLNGGTLLLSNLGGGTVDNDIALGSSNGTVNVASSAAILSGAITGSGSLAKTGGQLLTLSGSNSYSGGTTVSGANGLSVTGSDNLGSGAVTLNTTLKITGASTTVTNAIVINNDAAIISNASAVTLSGVISGTNAVEKQGAGALTLGGTNTHTGNWAISAGTLIASGGSAIGDSSSVTLSGSGVFRVSASETVGALTGNSSAATDVTIDNGMVLTATYGSNATMAGVIGGLGGFTKAGSGTLTLSGANSYSGATTLSGGGLTVSGGSAIGDSSAVSVATGTTLTLSSDETIGSLSGSGTVAIGANTLTTGVNNSSTTFSGTLTGSGAFSLDGSGTMTLSGSNSGGFSGEMRVRSGGTLSVAGDDNLGTGTVTLNGGTLTVTGAGTIDNAFDTGVNGATIDTGVAVTLSGAIGGNDGLTKTGSGTLTLSGTSSYAGPTTVSVGTLLVTGALGGTSAVSVASGATLGGTGSIFAASSSNTLTVASGATLAPGIAGTNNGVGSLTVNGNLSLSGTLAVEIAGTTTAGTDYDQVIVSGGVTLSSGSSAITVTRVNGFAATNASYRVIDQTGAGTLSNTLSGLAQGATMTSNGDLYTVDYAGGTGNDLVLNGIVNPTVSSVSASTADGSYKAGDTISITITFNRAVTVTGTPTLALGTGRTATYSSGSGGTTLTFTYTVQAGDTSADLDYASTAALALNGGTIADSSTSLAAILTLAAPGAANSLGANKAIIVDTTAPGAPTAPDMTAGTDSGSSSTDNVTSNTTPTFTGTAEPNSTVTLYDTDGTTVLGTGTTDGSGNYSVTATTALTPGTHTLTVKATDAAGNVSSVSGGLSVTVDTSAPATPGTPVLPAASDTGISASDGITRTTTPTITGTAEPNSTVTLYDTDGTTVLGTGTADGSGNYSVTVATALSTGPHTLTVKATDAAGNVSPASSGLSVTVDSTAPTVTGVTSSTADGSYKAGDTISIQVSLSETVIVNGTPTITLSNGRTATYSGSSGTGTLTFTYTVQAGDTAADLDYASTGALALNGGTITDTAGNDAATTLPAVGGGSSLGGTKNIVIDTTAPTVSSVSVPTGGIYKAGDVMEFTVAFNEAVTVTGSPILPITLDDGTVVQAAYVSGSGGTSLTFRYTVQAGLSDSDGVRLVSALTGGTITDLAGNAAVRTPGNVADTGGARIDSVPPTVTNVTSSTDNGTYTTGQTISIQVSFSEAVAVSGTPTLALNTGRTAVYSSGAGTSTLTFTYTVQAGDTAADLDAIGTSALAGSITDIAGNAGILTLTMPGDARSLGLNKDIAIDTTAPAIRSVIVPNDGVYGLGKTLSFYIQASEVVIVNGTPTITLDIGGQTRQAVYTPTGSSGTTLRFDYVVQAGDSDADGIAVTGLNLNGGGIADKAGLPLPTALTGLPGLQNVLVDTVAPDTPPAPVLAPGQDTGSSATDGVTSLNRPTLGGTAEAGSTVTVLVDGVAVGTTIAGSDGSWSFTPATPLADGTHAVTSRATDRAGNSSGTSAALTLTIDATAPVLSTPAISGIDNSANVISTGRPILTGSADPNSAVTVIVDGVTVGTATTGSDGRWSFAVTAPLADGSHNVVTTATDRAGNIGRSGTLSLTVDTQAPTVSGGSAPTLTAGGTATLGTAVSLSDASSLNRVTVTLTDARSGDELVIGALPAGITATRDGAGIVLTGVASAADYQAAVRAIGLRSSASDPSFTGTATSRSISIQARDLVGNSSTATTVTVAVARVTTTTTTTPTVNTTNSPAITTPVTGSGNGPSQSGSSALGSSSNGPSSNGSSSGSVLGGSVLGGGSGPSLPGGGSGGSAGIPGSSASTDAGRSVTLGSVGGSSASTDAGRSVTLGSVGGSSASTDAGRSVTLTSIGGSSSGSGSSSSGLGGSSLGGGLGGGLGGLGGGGLGSGLGGGSLGGTGLGGTGGTGGTLGGTGTGTGSNTGTASGGTTTGTGGTTRTGTNGQGTPGQTGIQGTGQNNGQGQGQGQIQGQGQDRGTGLGTGQGRGPTAGQPGNQGQQGQQGQGQQGQGQGEQQGQPQNQGAPQDGGGTPADGSGRPAERGADTRAEIMPASPGFARQVARAHGGPTGAADLLAALASHILPDSRAA
ncbi:Ig-like domain-containing protein, partial [Azospirillum sp. TSH64]